MKVDELLKQIQEIKSSGIIKGDTEVCTIYDDHVIDLICVYTQIEEGKPVLMITDWDYASEEK